MVCARQQASPPLREILTIAGPNGAGKTTFAKEFLVHEANCPAFVNADLIAAGLNPFQPEKAAIQAGRLMLDMIRDIVGAGESFAEEELEPRRTRADRSEAGGDQGARPRHSDAGLRRHVAEWQDAPRHEGVVFPRLQTTCLKVT